MHRTPDNPIGNDGVSKSTTVDEMSYIYSVDKRPQRVGEDDAQYEARLRTISIKKLNLTRMEKQKDLGAAEKKPEIREILFKGAENVIAALVAVQFDNTDYACLLNTPKGKLSLLRLTRACLRQQSCPGDHCRHRVDQPCYQVSDIDSGVPYPCALAHNRRRHMLAVISLDFNGVAFLSTAGAVGSSSPAMYDLGYQPEHIQFSPDGLLCVAAAARDRKLVLLLMSDGIIPTRRLVVDADFQGCRGPNWIAITEVEMEEGIRKSDIDSKKYIVTGICPKESTMKQGLIVQAVVTSRLVEQRRVRIGKVRHIKANLSAITPSAIAAYNIELRPPVD